MSAGSWFSHSVRAEDISIKVLLYRDGFCKAEPEKKEASELLIFCTSESASEISPERILPRLIQRLE